MRLVIAGKAVEITNPLEVIKKFCNVDISYRHYDIKELADDNWVERCIDLSNSGMNARISEDSKKLLQSKKESLEDLIKSANISRETSIFDFDAKKLSPIFKEFRAYNIQNAKITKILHKRFPNLVPVVDMLVGKYYFDNLDDKKGEKYHPDSESDLITVIENIKADMSSNGPILSKLQSELSNDGITLTGLRIFDIFVWIIADKKNKSLYNIQ